MKSSNHHIYIANNHIISPLGFDSLSNIEQISKGKSGIQQHTDKSILPHPFYASIIDSTMLNHHFSKIGKIDHYTRLEKMMILSLKSSIEEAGFGVHQLNDEKTALIISTTKGNIDALSNSSTFPKERAYLPELGKKIQTFLGFKNQPIVVSNACVSGILSVAIAKRLIQSGVYENVFIVSGDIVTGFILSGFNSFRAISDAPCKPFSKNRTGISIGEAAASVLITANKSLLGDTPVEILGDGSCNDANHISGPSRTAEGLYRSIQSAFKEANVTAKDIHYVSAHGTATPFNDEMEAIAMNRTGLERVPLNSLKGYYGHTLGASGLVETIVGIHSIHRNTLFQSMGFDELGVTQAIHVIEKTEKVNYNLNTFLKTASGFGGCNTAVVFRIVNG